MTNDEDRPLTNRGGRSSSFVISLAMVCVGCSEPAARETSAEESSALEVHVYRVAEVPDALVQRELDAMRRIYAPLRFTVTEAGHVDLAAATAGMLAHVPEEPTAPQRDAMWREMLGPALGFIRTRGIPARREVNVVFLARIAPQHSHARQLLPHLTGLTLTSDAEEPNVAELLGVEQFTPTVFLSAHDIQRLDEPPSTLAHEMGHALGLEHVEDPANVMASMPSSEPVLSDAQRSALQLP